MSIKGQCFTSGNRFAVSAGILFDSSVGKEENKEKRVNKRRQETSLIVVVLGGNSRLRCPNVHNGVDTVTRRPPFQVCSVTRR